MVLLLTLHCGSSSLQTSARPQCKTEHRPSPTIPPVMEHLHDLQNRRSLYFLRTALVNHHCPQNPQLSTGINYAGSQYPSPEWYKPTPARSNRHVAIATKGYRFHRMNSKYSMGKKAKRSEQNGGNAERSSYQMQIDIVADRGHCCCCSMSGGGGVGPPSRLRWFCRSRMTAGSIGMTDFRRMCGLCAEGLAAACWPWMPSPTGDVGYMVS